LRPERDEAAGRAANRVRELGGQYIVGKQGELLESLRRETGYDPSCNCIIAMPVRSTNEAQV
jgi:hypothetical protein